MIASPEARGRKEEVVHRGGAAATAARATSVLDRGNSDHAGWIKKFDDELARCRP